MALMSAQQSAAVLQDIHGVAHNVFRPLSTVQVWLTPTAQTMTPILATATQDTSTTPTL